MEHFYKIELQRVYQNGQFFYSSVFNAKLIINLFTTSPAKYSIDSYKIEGDLESLDEYTEYFAQERNKVGTGYQRVQDEKRVRDINDYISNNDNFNVIPNSIIIALNAIVKDSLPNSDDGKIYIIKEEEIEVLYISKTLADFNPDELSPVFIVDGHHRLQGIKLFLKEHEEFDIITTLLINRDKVDQAEIFKTVNYEVKAVNSSFYYQIMGEFRIGDSEYIFLHFFARMLNEKEGSPLYGRFKMLGKRDLSSPVLSTISQSYFVEQCFSNLLKPKKRFSCDANKVNLIPVLRYYVINDSDNIAAQIFVNYLKAIRKSYGTFDLWVGDDNPLVKTMGIGILIRIFPNIFITAIKNNFDEFYSNKTFIKEDEFSAILSDLLHKDGDFITELYDNVKASSEANVGTLAGSLWHKIKSKHAIENDIFQNYREWFLYNVK